MLDALRKSAGGFVAKIFIALLVLSFAVWGIADVFRGFGQNTVASVGSAEISALEFQRTYNREVQNFSRQIGQPLTNAQAASFGLPGQVLGRAIAEATFDHIAASLKIGISKDALVRQIQDDDMFKGPDGRFDRSRLQQLLYANGYSEDEYIRTRTSLARRYQIAEGLAGGTEAPNAMLEAMNQYRNEERTVRYLTLSADAVDPVEEPSQEALASYFEENKAAYRAPEYRKLELLVVDPQAIAKPQEISDEDAKLAYEGSLERFGTPERRQVLQLSFADKQAAEAAAARLAEGVAFEDLAKEEDTIAYADLGLLTRDKLIDPAIAEAAFGLAEGETSAPVEGRFTTVLLKVAKVEPAAVKGLDEVKDTLKQELALKRAEAEVLDLYDEVEDARAGGATLKEVAERFKLTLRTVDAVDMEGKDMAGAAVNLPDAAKLLGEAFQTDVGDEPAPVQIGQRGFAWYEVTGIVPDRDRTLDEVRDRVAADWKAAQLRERLAARAEEIAKRVRDGADLADIAAELSLEARTSEPLKRETSTDDLPVAAVGEAFKGPQGHVATAAADDRQIVMQVETVSVPVFFAEEAETAALAREMAGVMETTLIGQYVNAVQDEIGVEVNQAAVARAIGLGGDTDS